MGKIKPYIFLLLICIFLQNTSVCLNLLIGKLNTKDSFSILFRKAKNSASAKDDQKEKEKESKEESNQEGKEKEKEFKNIKYFNAFVYLSSGLDIYDSYGSEEFKIFSLYFEIETPPPEYVSEA